MPELLLISCRMEMFMAMYLVTTKQFSCLMEFIIMWLLPALDYFMTLPYFPNLFFFFFWPTVWWIQHEVPATQLCIDLCITIHLIWFLLLKLIVLTYDVSTDRIPDLFSPVSTNTFLTFIVLKFVTLPNWDYPLLIT